MVARVSKDLLAVCTLWSCELCWRDV